MKFRTWMCIPRTCVIGVLIPAISLVVTTAPADAQHNPLSHSNGEPSSGVTRISQTSQMQAEARERSNNSGVTLAAGSPGVSLLNPITLLSGMAILNNGTVTASNVTVTSITLTGGTLIFPSLPLSLLARYRRRAKHRCMRTSAVASLRVDSTLLASMERTRSASPPIASL